MSALPKVSALVLADAVDALPARLRKRLDDAALKAAAWPVEVDGDNYLVRVDDATTVTLLAPGGAVGTAGDVTCTCLLAPNCLHRVAVLAVAQVAEPDTDGADGQPAIGDPNPAGLPALETDAQPASAAQHGAADLGLGQAGVTQPGPGSPGAGQPVSVTGPDQPASGDRQPATDQEGQPAAELTAAQLAAAESLWQAGVAVLTAGVSGAGVVLRSALLRAVHEARSTGLHRAAAAGARVATGLHAARTGAPQFTLTGLTDELRELLGIAHALRTPGPAAPLGTARRGYDPQAGLRLFGLCAVPVVADTGYAGVVTYLVDRAGKLWGVSDLMPGEAERAARIGDATVSVGEAALSHRALTRAGLIVSGGTASDVGMLGAGKAVKATRSGGAGWADEPLARLFEQPLAEQARRAFDALALPVVERPIGADLVFVAVTVLGAGPDGVLARTPDGATLTLSVAIDVPALPFRENLRVLGQAVGAQLLLVGRPDPARRATVQALAVGATPATAEHLRLPAAWSGHIDLGYDRLHSSHLVAPVAEPVVSGGPPTRTTSDPALELMRRHLERVVAGGRAVQALAEVEERRLRRARLDLGAQLLGGLTLAARVRPRNTFGRLTGDDGAGFAQAWLSAAVYERAATRTFTEASWLS